MERMHRPLWLLCYLQLNDSQNLAFLSGSLTAVYKLRQFSHAPDKLIIESYIEHSVNVTDDNLSQSWSNILSMIVTPDM